MSRKAHTVGAIFLSIALTVMLAPSSATALRSGSWVWPVHGSHTITRNYLAPLTPFTAGHRGIDVLAQPGDEVLAPADGVVHFAGEVVNRGVLSIDHGQLLSSFEPITPSVTEGKFVKQGSIIGTVSESDHCQCLHVGAREKGKYLSPLALLASIEPAVLLPWDE